MASKRKRNGENEATMVTRSASRSAARATRSATRGGGAALQLPVDNPEPRRGKKAKKTVIIEHCNQCNSFKERANLVKNGLKKAIAGVNVVINPEEPRNGCFEIRDEDGEIFVSLVDMESPFAELEALDMKMVVSGIVQRLK